MESLFARGFATLHLHKKEKHPAGCFSFLWRWERELILFREGSESRSDVWRPRQTARQGRENLRVTTSKLFVTTKDMDTWSVSMLKIKCSSVLHPPLAQLVEQIPLKDKVLGSIPRGRTSINITPLREFFDASPRHSDISPAGEIASRGRGIFLWRQKNIRDDKYNDNQKFLW